MGLYVVTSVAHDLVDESADEQPHRKNDDKAFIRHGVRSSLSRA